MPKYYDFKVCGYYLYFTSKCIVEAMHVHASDAQLTEAGSGKFFVMENGDSVVQNKGKIDDISLRRIQKFIKDNYKEMYRKWSAISEMGYYEGR